MHIVADGEHSSQVGEGKDSLHKTFLREHTFVTSLRNLW